MLFFKKPSPAIKSDEYLELKNEYHKLRIEVEALKIELQLYAKKLKASRGLKKPDDDEDTENYKNDVLVRM